MLQLNALDLLKSKGFSKYALFNKLNNIMNQSIEYNYNDYSLTIISEWNKKSM